MFTKKTDHYFIITNKEQYRMNLLDYITMIDIQDKFVQVIYFDDIMPVPNINPIQKDIDWLIPYIIENKKLSEENNKKFVILIDGEYEAPTYRHNLKHSLDKISAETGIDTREMIIYGGAQHQFGEPVKFCISMDMSFSPTTFTQARADFLPDYHFISLARVAKPHRVLATVEILDRGLKDFGNMSLGSGYYGSNHENYALYLVPERWQHLMPMYLDGLITGPFNNQHLAVDERFTKSFINYAQETCYDESVSPLTWNSHFITEKTTKAFAWGQVPIFLTMSHSVQYLRDYGFDVFDDFINHEYYDSEEDPHLRIKKTVDELERVCKMSIDDLRTYKQNNMSRFIANRQLAEDFQDHIKSNISMENLKKVLTE